MDGIILLTEEQRKTALDYFRFGKNARVVRRAHVLILLDDNLSYRQIMEVMYCGSDLIADVKRRFLAAGLTSALRIPSESNDTPTWSETLCTWVSWHSPQDFGFFRSRWSCESKIYESSIIRSGSCQRYHLH